MQEAQLEQEYEPFCFLDKKEQITFQFLKNNRIKFQRSFQISHSEHEILSIEGDVPDTADPTKFYEIFSKILEHSHATRKDLESKQQRKQNFLERKTKAFEQLTSRLEDFVEVIKAIGEKEKQVRRDHFE